jgi:hypothetical protein
MTPAALLRCIRRLRAHQPLASTYQEHLQEVGALAPVWYISQKQHWLAWLAEYDGPGFYGRAVTRRTAEFAYNHVVCPPMVVWLGEAAGVSVLRVRMAIEAGLEAGPTLMGQAGAVRRVLPWGTVGFYLQKAMRRRGSSR